jgi:hypothetical protein
MLARHMSKASEGLRLESDVASWRTAHPGYENDGTTLGIRDTGGVLQFWKRTPSRIVAIDRIEYTARGGTRGKARGLAPRHAS